MESPFSIAQSSLAHSLILTAKMFADPLGVLVNVLHVVPVIAVVVVIVFFIYLCMCGVARHHTNVCFEGRVSNISTR